MINPIIRFSQLGFIFFLTSRILFSQTFTEQTGIILTGVDSYSNTVAWGDYDNDGDPDLLLSGSSSTEGDITKIYRNTGGTFTDISAGLPGITYGSVAWGDYDNDGDLDILLSGSGFSKIYRNDNGVFTDIIAGLIGITYSSGVWGDYDNDGDLDIALCGNAGSSTYVTKIYRNDNGVFTDIIAGLPGVYVGSVIWGDYDNDGDLDLLLTGWTGQIDISRVYRNDNGIFTDINAGLPPFDSGTGVFGDYDNDGDLDILLSGWGSSVFAKVYRNDGGLFTDIKAGLANISGSCAWADYDNDGDLDIILSGYNGSGNSSKIYRNDNGGFFDINAGLPDVYGSVAWGDYDNDGDLDFILTGYDSYDVISKIYRNNSSAPNSVPAAPSNLQSTITGNGIILSWNKSSDNQTPQNGLTYNVCIGTSSGTVNKKSPMAALPGGYRKITQRGDIQGNSWAIKKLAAGTYFWNVQAIDNNFGGSPFPTQGSFVVPFSSTVAPSNDQTLKVGQNCALLTVTESSTPASRQWKYSTTSGGPYNQIISGVTSTTCSLSFPAVGIYYIVCESVKTGITYTTNQVKIIVSDFIENTTISLPCVQRCSGTWGDYDNDGDLDVLITGNSDSEGAISRIYRNDLGVFNDIAAGLPGDNYSTGAWGDYDNDGDLDIMLTNSTGSKIFRNDIGSFYDTGTSLASVNMGSVAWGDYDNDGDLDILLTGYSSTAYGPLSKIYRNESGIFKDIMAGLVDVAYSSVSWGDYDNDGDLDILATGTSSSRIYRNDNGVFTDIVAGLPSMSYGSATWGDYDNDGDLDILLTGSNYSKVFRNTNGYFSDISASLPGVTYSSSAWGDYDNDGDLDILLTGNSTTGKISKIFSNTEGIFTEVVTDMTGVNYGSVAWGDYDKDGDLDVLITGSSAGGSISKVYQNNTLLPNDAPAEPSALKSTISANMVTIAWDNSTDSKTPQKGLTYNIYIGTTPGSANKKSPMAILPGGLRKIVQKGLQTNSWTIKNLSSGTYYWSVQAIDNSFAGSPFATGSSFTIPYTNSISPVAEQTLLINQNGNVLAVTETTTANSRQWKYSTISGGPYNQSITGATGMSYTPNFPNWGTYYVICESLKDAVIYTSNEVKIVIPLFSDISESNLIGTSQGSAVWGDYDNDGYLDILSAGWSNSAGNIAKIYHNNTGAFSDINAGLIGARYSSTAWGDYDNDGDLDIIVTGSSLARIYRNDAGAFVNISAGFPGINYSSASWGDYDNDGDLDVLLTGNYMSKIFRNDNGTFIDINAGLIGVHYSSATWGDYDIDGDLDILLTGTVSAGGSVSVIYRNDAGVFTDILAGLPGVTSGSVAWGDYDSDGDLDVLLAGNSSSGPVAKIFRNDNGSFPDINAGLTGVQYSSAAWGDYDNDGDLDILLTGAAGISNYIAKIYRNDSGIFNEFLSGLTGVQAGSVAWGDYDKDGDLDILMTGQRTSGFSTAIYRNNITSANVPPASPSGLSALVGVNKVTLSWTKATDPKTAQNGLSYNLYIGTTAGSVNKRSPMASVTNGYRRIVKPGASQKNGWVINGLTAGTYFWSVQAIDNSYAGSSFSTESSFTVPFSNSISPVAEQNLLMNQNGIPLTVTESSAPTSRQWKYSSVSGGPYSQIIPGAVGTTYTPNFAATGNYYVVCEAIYTTVAYASNEVKISVPVFTDIYANLPGVYQGSVEWGDYDNDGDLDILLTGNGYSSIYRNDAGVFTDISAGLPVVSASSADWGDFDNDGDLDILLTGSETSKIFRNNGGFFTDINAGLKGIKSGAALWGDCDNDGDLDIFLCGSNISKIYRNDGGIFTDINAGLPGVTTSSAAWGDYDNDGDLDILLTGMNGSEPISKVFRNDNGVYTDLNAGLTGVSNGSVAWGDYDSDGDLDILLTGLNITIPVSKIYSNDNNVFTDINAGFTGVSRSSAAWGDFNNDGALDFVQSGNSQSVGTLNIYLKNSNAYIKSSRSGIAGNALQYSSVAWGDYDNDGDLDLLAAGVADQAITKIFRNNSTTSNTVPTSPTNLQASLSSNKVILTWNKSTDANTPQNGLTYNLYVGTSSRAINRKTPMAIVPGGYRKIVRNGIHGNTWFIKNLPAGTYYWSVQAIDQAYAGSAFPADGTFTVAYANAVMPVTDQFLAMNQNGSPLTVTETSPANSRQWKYSTVSGGPYDQVIPGATATTYTPLFPSWGTYYVVCVSTKDGVSYISNEVRIQIPVFLEQSGINLPGINFGSVKWGDYDNDGDLDVFITGSSILGPISRIYRNDGGVFTNIDAGIINVSFSSSAWGDYDSDGDLDLLTAGYISTLNYVAKIYRNNGGVFTDINAGLPGINEGSVDWGDYDNDGDLDILITGYMNQTSFISRIYRNDNGSFSDISAGLTGVYQSSAIWGDYDNDGDLDILLAGYVSSTSRISKIYRNDNGVFTDIIAGLTEVYDASAAWGDYDNDGDLDILLTGVTGSELKTSKIYRNDNGVFTEMNSGLAAISSGSVGWGDYDNDGDLDILMSGNNLSKIYRNDNNVFKDISSSVIGLSDCSSAWGDYDKDGDLDFILSGYMITENTAKIYKNTSLTANTLPTTPANLKVSPVSLSKVTLSWDKSTDTQTPQTTITYNIRLGTSPGTSNIISPMSSATTGFRMIPARGNSEFKNSGYTLANLTPGNYYWSVQAVDQAYAGGSWATESSFTLLAAPVAVAATGISQTTFTANWQVSDGATGYRVDVASDPGFTSFVSGYDGWDTEPVTSLNISGLTANTTFYYRIRARNANGISIIYSNTITATTLVNPPGTPVANDATAITKTGFTANWSSSPTASGYRLDVATDNAFTIYVADFNNKDVSNVTNFSITGLSANTIYYYRVRAYNAGGTSANSNIVTPVTISEIPSIPVAISAVNVLQTSFKARWNSSSFASGYRLDVSSDIGFATILSGYNNVDVGNVTSFTVTGLTKKTTYYYRIKAYSSGGTTVYSNTISVVTLQDPPPTPAGLVATSCNNSVTISWGAITEAEFLRYRIYRGTTVNPTTMIDSTSGPISETTKNFQGLTNGQTYYYAVSAVNNQGVESPISSSVSVKVKTGVIPRIKLKWNAVVISYNAGDSLKAFQWYNGITAIAGANKQYFITSQPGSYHVVSTDNDGCKNSSNIINVSASKSLTVYPNPAKANFILNLSSDIIGSTTVSLFNSSGIKVLEYKTEKTESFISREIPVNRLPEGIYTVEVRVNNEEVDYVKLLIIK